MPIKAPTTATPEEIAEFEFLDLQEKQARRKKQARQMKISSPPATPEDVAEYLNRRESDPEDGQVRPILRRLVDAWIESGKGRKGEDSPWDRRTDDWNLQNYVKKNPPSIGVSYGQIVIDFHYQHSIFDPEKSAYYIFLNFLTGPREKLNRCDFCSAYFSHRNMPVIGAVTKGGCFCSKCRHRANSVTAIESRKRNRKHLVKLAATFWNQYGEKKRNIAQVEWVTNQMCKKCGNLSFSGAPTWKNTRWVSQHREAIEVAARRLERKA